MRIIVAHNRYKYAGGEDAVAANEIAMLRAHGHAVFSLEADNTNITGPLTTITAAGALFGSGRSYTAISAAFTDFQPDILHIHNWFPLLSPSVISAANHSGIPVVQTLHNFRMLCANGVLYRDGAVCQACVGKAIPLSGVGHGCYRDSRPASAVVTAAFAYHRAVGTWKGISRFIALSEFQKQLLIRGGIPDSQITIKPNFIPDTRIIGNGEGNYFLFVGRLTPEKGIRTALRAWEEHALSLPLHIIGDGPLRHEVTERAANCCRIRYLGPRTPSEVAAQMASAKGLIFPSEWYEPFALTLIEAFSHGTPVIASDVESIRSLVEPNRTGLSFPPGSAETLARQVLSLINSPNNYCAMRTNCRAEYESRYTAAANYPLLLDIYERAVEEARQRSAFGALPQASFITLIQAAPDVKPPLANIIGSPVHAVNMKSALAAIHFALLHRRKGYICLAGAHGIMQAHRDPAVRAIAHNALLVLPDGMPTVWLGRSQGHSAMDRVFGPDLMLEIFARPDFRQTTHFFWGGADGVADRLREAMQRRFPDVKIVGAAAPPFRDLTEQEQGEFVAQIAQLQPDIIWVGVSTPKQDKLMAELSPLLDSTLMIGVGAAFLFHTGALQDSPGWMKRAGLQWLHRFLQEPSRLWRRYLSCVPAFAFHSLLQISGLRKYPFPSNVIAEPRATTAQPVPR